MDQVPTKKRRHIIMGTGYSETQLIKRLGIKAGNKICIINGPENYWELLGELPLAVEKVNPYTDDIDFIHIFAKSKEECEQLIDAFKQQINQKGMIWVSWPKKASKLSADLNEDCIRRVALENKLVDVKVCAIDDTWSGLKLVIPVKYRA